MTDERAAIEHVADCYNRYPGEAVTLFTRLTLRAAPPGLTLRIHLPPGLDLEGYQAPAALPDLTPRVEVDGPDRSLVWLLGTLPPERVAGQRYEFQLQARVAPTEHDRRLSSRARLTAGDHALLAEAEATVAVQAKGRYLRYLPEIYSYDELLGRFLMLFESFWAPIETQIDAVPYYLDARMTPDRLLPWLAGWLGLELDEHLPRQRQRRLVRAAIRLFRQRGTRTALREYLEIYTGGQAQIVEHRADDFRLGPEARLGVGIALGTGHRPHSFTVTLRLPPGELPSEARARRAWRRRIEALIEAEKPAHTHYTLVVEPIQR